MNQPKTTKKQKLQRLLKVLTPDNTQVDFSSFDAHVNDLKSKLKEKVQAQTLQDVNVQLEKFRRRIDIQPLKDAIDAIQKSFEEKITTTVEAIDERNAELETLLTQGDIEALTRIDAVQKEISALQSNLTDLEKSQATNLKKVQKSIPDLTDIESRLAEFSTQLSSRLDALENEEPQEIKDWTDTIEKVRKDLLGRINNIGGGSMNRKITFNGTDYLTKYTDINYKAGTNVTFTISTNDQTKMVDVTVASTGGAGSGIVRSINSISTDTTAGATASTDYVYLVSGTTVLTLPTAVGNTNLYTVKNVGTGVVTIATTSAQTIDGSTTITMPVQYTSVDLTSDTANWNIT